MSIGMQRPMGRNRGMALERVAECIRGREQWGELIVGENAIKKEVLGFSQRQGTTTRRRLNRTKRWSSLILWPIIPMGKVIR